MKDRFRFRAWDKKNKRMLYNIQGAYDGGCIEDKDGEEMEDYCESCFDSFFPYEGQEENEYIVEQCTGLKDKNGELIYEGDVVEAVVQNHYKLKGVICWEIDRYQIKELNAPVLFDLYEALYDIDTGFEKNTIEVIGNIHENPELLEK